MNLRCPLGLFGCAWTFDWTPERCYSKSRFWLVKSKCCCLPSNKQTYCGSTVAMEFMGFLFSFRHDLPTFIDVGFSWIFHIFTAMFNGNFYKRAIFHSYVTKHGKTRGLIPLYSHYVSIPIVSHKSILYPYIYIPIISPLLYSVCLLHNLIILHPIPIWLVVLNIVYFPSYMGCHPSHWLIFFKMVIAPPISDDFWINHY